MKRYIHTINKIAMVILLKYYYYSGTSINVIGNICAGVENLYSLKVSVSVIVMYETISVI